MNDKTNLIVVIALVVAVVVLATNTSTPTVNVGGGATDDTVTSSGSGKVTVSPDEAEVYINIITEGVDAVVVQDDNAEIMKDVRTALSKLDIDKEDIETSSYYLYPKTTWDRDTGESNIYGYQLTHTIMVTTDEINDVGKIVDAAVKSGANGLNSINFQLSDNARDAAYEDALAQAAQEAKSKADIVTKSLGAKLGKISTISSSSVSYNPYRYYDTMEMAVGSAPKAETVISPEDVDVTAQVTVVYKIE